MTEGTRIGLVSPIVVAHPASTSEWERTGTLDDLAAVAEAADTLGFHHLTCSEHVAVPTPVATERGGTYWDPLATFGFLAARTRRIRLSTHVLVLGYHHPLEIAKRYGTLDVVSGGRVVLGLGVGTLREEFELLGAEFEKRGAVADDALRALRAALGSRTPRYDGEYFRFDDVVVDPCAVQQKVPLWIGGRTRRSLRRALELGDGWAPFGLSSDDLASMLSSVALPAGFDLVLGAGALDPLDAPDRVRSVLERRRASGATVVGVEFAARSRDHYLDQMRQFVSIADELGFVFTPA